MNEIQITEISINAINSLALAGVVVLLGQFLIKHVGFLNRFTIPGPVAGGLLIALILFAIREFAHIEVSFNAGTLQDTLMLMFFASVGLSANIAQLKAGGRVVAIFLVCVSGLVIIQNTVGVSLALLLDQNPLMGLLAGSITLSGGHGTGKAWSDIFISQYGFEGALEIAMACATFGLVFGGLIGGPIARFLINRMGRKQLTQQEQEASDSDTSIDLSSFQKPQVKRSITTSSMIETITVLIISAAIGSFIFSLIPENNPLRFPAFVFTLFTAVIIGNTLPRISNYEITEKAVSVTGNVCLSLFLAMALMSLKLWQLTAIALPMLTILIIQTCIMALYAIFVTFRVMGSNYDSAVLAAGHCGFGLGATPTAIVNMQVVTDRFGPSPLAFLVVPMVGAFFVDLVNALAIQGFLSLPFFTEMLTTAATAIP